MLTDEVINHYFVNYFFN